MRDHLPPGLPPDPFADDPSDPSAALDALEAIRPIRPNRRALAISQDRILEKDFLTGIGLACAPWRP